jgi:hypothetical protein
MQTTFRKIAGQIIIEVAKSATFVIISTVLSQALRKSANGAVESVAQAVNYTRNKVYDLRHKEKAA